METAKKSRNYTQIISWIFFFSVVSTCIILMVIHVKDILNSDMASEMILAKQLSQSGSILSNQWYYSTELRVINTQLFYALFFHLTNDWQLVRIFGNILLYLAFLSSFFFLCKQLKIDRYFPILASILFLPLSEDYTAVILIGAYYVPRISMMFFILGDLVSAGELRKRSVIVYAIFCFLSIAFSFALGLEGARMILVLFMPIAILVGFECGIQIHQYRQSHLRESISLRVFLKNSGFLKYFSHAFVICISSAIGFGIHQLFLTKRYPFNHFNLLQGFSFSNVKETIADELVVIGNISQTNVFSYAIYTCVFILLMIYLFKKFHKSLVSKRFIGLSMTSLVVYTIFSFVFQFGQAPRHFLPVAILFLPMITIVLKELPIKLTTKKFLCVALCLGFFIVGIPGYASYMNKHTHEFNIIAPVLEKKQFNYGYATFWNGNVLTELTDGKVDVWCVTGFDNQTLEDPDLFLWLQDKAHDQTIPSGKGFIIWSQEEYDTYHDQEFDYLGKEIYHSEHYVVYEIEH